MLNYKNYRQYYVKKSGLFRIKIQHQKKICIIDINGPKSLTLNILYLNIKLKKKRK